MRAKSDVYVIMPVYNEARVVGDVITDVRKRFDNIVCVDDGSRDNSAVLAEAAGAQVVKHAINLGQGAALQTGIEYALLDPQAKYFVTYDADGQHSLDDVEAMLKEIKRKNLDIVLGSRFLGKVENIKKSKKLLLKMAIIFSNKTSGLHLTDTHNGLRVFNRTVAEGLNITMPDFAHASEIIERIAEKKYTYAEVPVTITYTDYSRSKGQSLMNAINIGIDMLIKKAIHK